MMKKDLSIRFIRVLATITIVLYHSFSFNMGTWSFFPDSPTASAEIPYFYATLNNVCGIALNCFVFIAAILYARGVFTGKYAKSVDFVLKKAHRLLVPYLIWGALTYLLFYEICYFKWFLGGLAHLWFLLMIFNLFVLAALTRKCWMNSSPWVDGVVLIVVFAISQLNIGFIQHHLWIFSINRTLQYIPMFFLGLLIVKYDHKTLPQRFLGYPLMLAATTLFLIIDPLVSFPKVFHNILIITEVWMLYKSLPKSITHIKNSKGEAFLSLIDRNSMGIYILHHTFIWLLVYFSSYCRELLLNNGNAGGWFMFLTAFFASLFCSAFIDKIRLSKYLFG